MTDTPRVPEFRWAPVPQWLGAVYVQSRERWYELAVKPDPVDLPADAVKLGDVEALRRDLDEYRNALNLANAQTNQSNEALDALRADIRAVLTEDGFGDADDRVREALGVLDREPGREERKP